MSYRCQACGLKRTKAFPGGCCPACDSFNIRRTTTKQAIQEKEPKTLLELFILVLVWSLLLYGIYDRYLGK